MQRQIIDIKKCKYFYNNGFIIIVLRNYDFYHF